MGLTKLFIYPSHVVSINAVTPGEHCSPKMVHIASIILHEKNGTQHIRKTPVTFPFRVKKKRTKNEMAKKKRREEPIPVTRDRFRRKEMNLLYKSYC